MDRQSKFWYLKHVNIFEGMDDASMEKVNQMSSMSSVRSHQPLYFPDEPTQAIFFLKEGHVKISQLAEDGKEIILDVLGPGEIFGELSFSGSGDASGELAQALVDAVIFTL